MYIYIYIQYVYEYLYIYSPWVKYQSRKHDPSNVPNGWPSPILAGGQWEEQGDARGPNGVRDRPLLGIFRWVSPMKIWISPKKNRDYHEKMMISPWQIGSSSSNKWDFTINQWPFQEPKLEVSTMYKAYIRPMYGNIPTKYGLIWYSTSNLGSWNSHWINNEDLTGKPCGCDLETLHNVGHPFRLDIPLLELLSWPEEATRFVEAIGWILSTIPYPLVN